MNNVGPLDTQGESIKDSDQTVQLQILIGVLDMGKCKCVPFAGQ